MLGRGLHPVPLHDRGGHRQLQGFKATRPSAPAPRSSDVGGREGGDRLLRLDRPRALAEGAKEYAGDIFTVGAGLTGMQSFAPLMYTLLAERGLPVTAMARLCSESRHGSMGWTRTRVASGSADADFGSASQAASPRRAHIRDREDNRWSPYHGRAMKARVASTWLRGAKIWDGTVVNAKPGPGRFVPRQHRRSALDG